MDQQQQGEELRTLPKITLQLVPSSAQASAGGPGGSLMMARQTSFRCSVVRRCRDFYKRRLERAETLRQKWNCDGTGSDGASVTPVSSSASESGSSDGEGGSSVGVSAPSPTPGGVRKWNSSLDIAMDTLRSEISSLIARDNDLFRQLLNLYDNITELREQQSSPLLTPTTPGSLESLSDTDGHAETSPFDCSSGPDDLPSTSDVSRSSSIGASSSPGNDSGASCSRRSRSSTTSACPDFCWRCCSGRKRAPIFRRRAMSYANLNLRHDHMDSFDSGIHLQGGHSESDHEIFV